MYARIAVNIPSVAGVFDYSLPAGLLDVITPGHLVTVPFGKQTVQGVVLELTSQPAVAETKPVLSLLDPQPVLTAAQISLACTLARENLSPLAACIGMMLPPGLNQQADVLYRLADAGSAAAEPPKSPLERRLLALLQEKGPLRGRQLDRHFRNVDWRNSARRLVRLGVLAGQPVLPPASVRPKFIRVAMLAVSPQTAEQAMPTLGMRGSTLSRRQAALRFLMRAGGEVNVSWVYAESGCNLSDLQELAEREWITLRESEIWRDPLLQAESSRLPAGAPAADLELTPAQQAAWKQILAAFQSPDPSGRLPFLLQGVTGSGKTELYIRAARECVRLGKEAIILVPEIALTPQTVQRFLVRFPGQVGLVHSRLSEGERYDTWRRARLGALQLVIGPRSALFSPLPHVGLIVVDECHDGSYYQSEPPFYNAVSAAREYARQCGAVCILGSATPSVVQRHQAAGAQAVPPGEALHLLELPGRIEKPASHAPLSGLPPVHIVDMREELKSGNRGIFSRELADSLSEVLRANRQAILFLNRRGTATYVFCRNCGASLRCPRCDAPLTLHARLASSLPGLDGQPPSPQKEELLCHRCGYSRLMPKTCPACGSDRIGAYGLGSEKVEAEVRRLFPPARTLRWDRDTTPRKGAHEIILAHFSAHRADVLIGTQMLAKGLDLPLVTLVGIVLADMGLNLPDPFAAERTFDVLTQVAGRAGRSPEGGRVVLQTFQPEHYVIRHAAGHDYSAFYSQELEYRRALGYPPFYSLVRLEFRHPQSARAEAEAQVLSARLQAWIAEADRRETTLMGPAPCFFARLEGQYRWQIVLRGPDPAGLLREKGFPQEGAPSGWRVEVNPISLL